MRLVENNDDFGANGMSYAGLYRDESNLVRSQVTRNTSDAGLLDYPGAALRGHGNATKVPETPRAPAAAIDFQTPPERPVQLVVKRGLDVVGAAIGLLILSPLLIAIAILIKATSKGPIFFHQNRTGQHNRQFRILKFRSMYVDQCDRSGVAQTIAGDPRVTPVGRMLRRTNLDELPQLVNVLLGDMSLVGPRPHVPGMLAAGVPYETLVEGYEARHVMRPGITGLAQVNGLRGPTTDADLAIRRVEHDIDYVRNFSLLLDVKLILKTIFVELRGGSGF